MKNLTDKIALSQFLARRLFPVTLLIGILISTGFPATFYVLESILLRKEANELAYHLSEKLENLIVEAQSLWKYQTYKYDYIVKELMERDKVTHIRVFDEAGRPIVGYERVSETANALWNYGGSHSSAPIILNNRQAGTVQVELSQSYLIGATLGVLVIATTMGISLAVLAYRFPIKTVVGMEGHLQELVDTVQHSNAELERKAAEEHRLAVENTRLFKETEKRARELSALHTVVSAVSGSIELNEVLERALHAILLVTGMESGHIRLLEGEPTRFTLKAHKGISPGRLERLQSGIRAGGRTDQVLATKQTLVLENLGPEPTGDRPSEVLRESFTAAAWVPILLKDRVVGIINLATNETGTFLRDQIPLLESIGASLGVAIENANLYQATKRQEEIQKILKELSLDITSLDLDHLFRKLTEHVLKILQVDVSDVMTLEKGGWHVIGVSGMEPEKLRSERKGTGRGRSKWIIENRKPLLIPDITQGPEIASGESIQKAGIRGYLAVPLFSRDGEVIGILRALSLQPRAFTEGEVDLLQQLANGAAIALEDARLFKETEQRASELSALHTVISAVSGSLDIDQVLEKSLDAVLQVTGMKVGYIQFLDPVSRRLTVKVQRGMSPDFAAKLERGIRASGKTEQIISTKRSIVLENMPPDRSGKFAGENIKAAAWVPIMSRDKVMGIINVATRGTESFSPRQISLLESIGAAVGVAVENAELFTQTERRRQEAQELARLAAALTASLDIYTVGERIVQSVLALFTGRSSVLRLLQPDGSLVAVAAAGPARNTIKPGHVLPPGFATAGQAVREGRAICTADIRSDPNVIMTDDMRGKIEGAESFAAASVPLRVKGKTIGSLSIGDSKERAFSESEIALLQAFGDQAALALDNARLFQEVDRRRKYAEVLREIGLSLTTTHDPQQVLERVAEEARRLIGALFTFVATPATPFYKIAAVAGDDQGYRDVLKLSDDPDSPYGQGPLGRAIRNRTPVVCEDVLSDPLFVPWRDIASARGIHSLVAVPLLAQ